MVTYTYTYTYGDFWATYSFPWILLEDLAPTRINPFMYLFTVSMVSWSEYSKSPLKKTCIYLFTASMVSWSEYSKSPWKKPAYIYLQPAWSAGLNIQSHLWKTCIYLFTASMVSWSEYSESPLKNLHMFIYSQHGHLVWIFKVTFKKTMTCKVDLNYKNVVKHEGSTYHIIFCLNGDLLTTVGNHCVTQW